MAETEDRYQAQQLLVAVAELVAQMAVAAAVVVLER
jgi:hypothetical protein